MSDPRRSFGTRLAQLRRVRGLSQEALAKLCGLHRTYVSSIERGQRNVSLLTIVKLARALRVKPAALVE
jgi:transcriptional regulator with XRE-family HTH domain